MNNLSFKNILTKIILRNNVLNKLYTVKHPNKKYNLDDIIIDIIYVLKNGIAWRNIRSKINWNTLYWHFRKFVKHNIFHKLFNILRKKYFKNNKTNIHIVDSTFIMNKFGINKISRNKFFKNKNCNKISYLTDIHGIPLSVFVNKGTIHDNKFVLKHMNDCYFVYKNKDNTLLADKAYESRKIRETLIDEYNCDMMIAKKKNSKTDYPFNKNIYKKRTIIENTFQKLKAFRRIMIRYDKLISTYKSFVYFASSILIHRAMPNFL